MVSPGQLTVRPYAAEERATWDSLVGSSRSGHFMFLRGYMEYHRDRFVDASLLVFDGEAAVAVLPASRDGGLTVSHGGLTFGGLVSEPKLTTRRTLDALAAVLDHLRNSGSTALVYKAVPHIYHRLPAEEDLYALFRLEANLVRRDCSVAIRADSRLRYTKGRRAALGQAAAAGLKLGRDPGIAEFMELESEALQRRHGVAPVHTAAEMCELADRFPDNIKLYTARQGGDDGLLGGVLVYETDVVAHAQYIAGTEQGYAGHALDAVIDFLLAVEYEQKRWFDFGISTTDEGRELNTGLVRNKESFGARAVMYDTYRLELG
jgi:hypothetical protein